VEVGLVVPMPKLPVLFSQVKPVEVPMVLLPWPNRTALLVKF
jgi:hypothetical protein